MALPTQEKNIYRKKSFNPRAPNLTAHPFSDQPAMIEGDNKTEAKKNQTNDPICIVGIGIHRNDTNPKRPFPPIAMKCLRPTTTDGLGVGRAGERRRRYTKMAQTFAEAKLENLYRTGAIFLHFFVANAPNVVNEDSEIGCRRTCNCCYQVVGIPHLPGPALNGRYCQPRSPRMDGVGDRWWRPGASGAKRSMGSTLCR